MRETSYDDAKPTSLDVSKPLSGSDKAIAIVCLAVSLLTSFTTASSSTSALDSLFQGMGRALGGLAISCLLALIPLAIAKMIRKNFNFRRVVLLFWIVVTAISTFGTIVTKAPSTAPTSSHDSPKTELVANKWKRYLIGNTGISLESPGAFNATSLDVPETARKMIKALSSYKYSGSGLEAFVSHVVYNPDIPTSLDGAAQGAIDNLKALKGVSRLKERREATTVSGKQGTMLYVTFDRYESRLECKYLLLVDESTLWQVGTTFQAADSELQRNAARILQSVSIDTKDRLVKNDSGLPYDESINENLYRSKQYRFRIKFPVGWQIKDGDGEHVVKKAESPDLGQVNILVRRVDEGSNMADFSSSELDEFQQLFVQPLLERFNGKVLSQSVKYLNNHKALYCRMEVTYKKLSGDYQAINQQFLTINKGLLYIVTTTSRKSDFERLGGILDESVGSFVIEDWD